MKIGTSTVEMTITDLDGGDDKVSDGLSLHPPYTEADYWHLEAIIECDCH